MSKRINRPRSRQRPTQRCLIIDNETWANLWRVALRRKTGNLSATVCALINEEYGR